MVRYMGMLSKCETLKGWKMISSMSSHGEFSSRLVARKYFIKKVSLVILKNWQENTLAGDFFYYICKANLIKKDSGTSGFL